MSTAGSLGAMLRFGDGAGFVRLVCDWLLWFLIKNEELCSCSAANYFSHCRNRTSCILSLVRKHTGSSGLVCLETFWRVGLFFSIGTKCPWTMINCFWSMFWHRCFHALGWTEARVIRLITYSVLSLYPLFVKNYNHISQVVPYTKPGRMHCLAAVRLLFSYILYFM